jgi:hypothetical protein
MKSLHYLEDKDRFITRWGYLFVVEEKHVTILRICDDVDSNWIVVNYDLCCRSTPARARDFYRERHKGEGFIKMDSSTLNINKKLIASWIKEYEVRH